MIRNLNYFHLVKKSENYRKCFRRNFPKTHLKIYIVKQLKSILRDDIGGEVNNEF